MTTQPTLDRASVEHFNKDAGKWWDAGGPFKPLHRIAPQRIAYISDQLCRKLGRNPKGARSLSGLTVLDIGCGGGLVAEPLTRLGAQVTGIDPGPENIDAAKTHAAGMGLAIDYRAATAEDIAASGASYDAVLLLEVVEHVPDVPAFLKSVAPLLRPGGLVIVSTINRTLKAYAVMIVAAEFVLRWVPAGTHQWDKFVTPAELRLALKNAGLSLTDTTGLVYDPLADAFRLSRDRDVNYFATAQR
jgi:2-polyprenyl-6-hydroxyphenyl methylase/3-demethylubiquinone-9 3-methyltransferase